MTPLLSMQCEPKLENLLPNIAHVHGLQVYIGSLLPTTVSLHMDLSTHGLPHSTAGGFQE